MAGCSSFNKLQGKAISRALEHVESLAEAQIAKNIHSKVIAPVAHLSRLGPALSLFSGTLQHTNLLAESTDVTQDVSLHLLHSALGEGLRHDTALTGMDLLIARVMRIGGRVNEGIVEFGLADVCAEAVYLLESLIGVEAKRVGAEADNWAVFLVHAPELELPVTLPGVVELVSICDLSDEWAWVLG